MAEDIFGNEIAEPDDLDAEDGDVLPEDDDTSANPESDLPAGDPDDTLTAPGEPEDIESIRKHWQAAYTRSRQADREKYGKVEEEHGQYQQMLAQFYQNDDYAKQILAQRFPELAAQIRGTGQPTRSQNSTTPNGLTSELEQSLGDYGFLAQAIGPALERIIDQQVQARVAPLEQRTTQQAESARKRQEYELQSAMDGKYKGWEESYGAKMQELDDFLASDALTHPVYGSKYELYYKLLNPDIARVEAAREMGDAAKRRTSLGRTGRQTAPNVSDEVRKAESDADAFMLASKAAQEEVG